MDFNLYPYLSDVDHDAVFVLNAAATLPNRFSYFGFINLNDEPGRSISYFAEQNLRWQVAEGSAWDLTFQANLRTGSDNSRYRLGTRWRLSDSPWLKSFFDRIHLRYALNLHAITFDDMPGGQWQLEHSFGLRFPYWSDRLYLAGFIDHNFNEKVPPSIPKNPIVTEVQVGYELARNLFVVAEYRVIEYRRSDVNNLALGVEYKVVW